MDQTEERGKKKGIAFKALCRGASCPGVHDGEEIRAIREGNQAEGLAVDAPEHQACM